MHWYGQNFTFLDSDLRVLLKIGGVGWTADPLLEVSEALGVPLYDYRTKHGLGTDATAGQLMQRAARAK